MENLYTPNCIRTNSGIYFNILEPTVDMIDINDIAHALSHQCRFGGHLPVFYSVAQHCVHCADLIIRPYKLAALLHDASEAYLLDIPKPIKYHLTNYSDFEDKIMNLIAAKYGFYYPLQIQVKFIDNTLLEMEWENIMLQKATVPLLQSWSPSYAKERFLKLFHELTPELR